MNVHHDVIAAQLKTVVPAESRDGSSPRSAQQQCPALRPVFRERAAIFYHTVRGALSPPHTSRAPGFATQDHAQARDSNAAQGNTQDMEATSGNVLMKECQGCSETRRPSRPASRIQSSGAIVTSQSWIQLTGGYARCETRYWMPVRRCRQVWMPAIALIRCRRGDGVSSYLQDRDAPPTQMSARRWRSF